MWMHPVWTNFILFQSSDSAAMFPGRYPTVPDNMWTFWNPQAMGLQGQFCGGDLMNQQSQAQSQAQTQAQLAALREQNNILNQQLGLQAQTHIQHLQQLLPFHQSTFHPHPPQPTTSVPDPPTPVAPQSTPPGSSASFNAEEMMQQMKNTVESSMQAFVDKTQERNMNQPPAPAQPPIQASPPIPSHPPPPDEVPPQPQQSHRRSRSRSHRHRGAPDKRPVSVPRSPRRATPPKRTHRSSRPRSSHRRRHSTQDVQVELLLSICGQPLHVDEKYYQTMLIYIVMHPAVNQLHFTQHRGNTNAIIKIHHPTTSTTSMTTHPMTSHPPTSGNPGTNGRTILSPSLEPIHRAGLIIPKPPQTSPLLWLFLQVFQQTSHCIFLRPSTSTSTQIQLNPISCLHQCCPPRTCSHQSPRWFERGMGSSCRACFESSRQDASCQWTQGWRASWDDHLHSTRWIRCCEGTAPSGRFQNSSWCTGEGCPTVLQHQPSSGLRPLHLLRPWTSSHQHACTHHATAINQSILDATSFWQST